MIKNTRALASKLNVQYKTLTYLLYIEKTDNCYTSFNIKKKNGADRQICAPSPKLKSIQRNLATFLYNKKIEIDKIISEENKNTHFLSHGFELKKNIITNATIHRNKRYVLNIDLKDFFDSFHIGRIIGYFNKNINFLYPKEVATMIAQISCYKGKLPQGSPASPVITNLICQNLDVKLHKIAKAYKLYYTRYADDITFSTNDKNFLANKESILKKIITIINKNGFEINPKKTRLTYKDSKQIVTGLIVNKKINIENNYFKITKAMADSLYKNKKFFIDGQEGTMSQLEGRFAFIDQLDKYNNKHNPNNIKQGHFNRREIEYQKFLFYKNFLNNEKPIIITEGKTDPLYIKAALMKNYDRYPNLIEKTKKGFNFKFSFFIKKEKYQYFFRFSRDGGDAMQKIFSLYSGNEPFKKCKNALDKYKIVPQNPVILLFDNEQQSKNKPLKQMLTHIDKFDKKILGELEKQTLSNDSYVRIFKNLNLYLATMPLPKNMKECEIEDLLDDSTLKTIIDGRTFQAKVDKGDSLHYSKDVLSKYVYDNYKKLNFDGFIGLLDNLNKIISTHKS